MGKIRRKFDIQFKIQVCQRIEGGLQTITEICRDHQLQRAVVESWLQRFVTGTLTAKVCDREKELEREVEKLKSKVGELTMTIDILKKVEAFKRQQTSASSLVVTSRNLAQYQRPASPLDSPPRVTTTNRNGTR